MILVRRLLLTLSLLFLIIPGLYAEGAQDTQESDQQINDFNLVGYGERGKKSWDLAGKTANIFTDVVKLQDVEGNLYGKEEDVNLLADKGDFNKKDGKIHLEDNVVITTTSGMKLTTDSLDYDRKNQLMTTPDIVNIARENLTAVARGASGDPGLKKVALKEEVRLDIIPATAKDEPLGSKKEKIIITCDGPLEIDYEKNIAEFNKNVKVDRDNSQIYSDKMIVYFIPGEKKAAGTKEDAAAKDTSAGLMTSSIDKIFARGNVKVVRGENTSYSDEAIYNTADSKIILQGRPKLILYSTEEMKNAPLGG
ncbi:MAG: LPS export ABC transporter periplasmic protein LptC [Candidatus Omnitrophica bacterium]|nr:LPS export ABC transporter periplasmic protein LptC [Candidatus Omnitrophota bacterium]